MPLFTIQNSIVTTVGNEDFVQDVLIEELEYIIFSYALIIKIQQTDIFALLIIQIIKLLK